MVGHSPGTTIEDATWVSQDEEEALARKADILMSNGFHILMSLKSP